jgi:hypothetical protein
MPLREKEEPFHDPLEALDRLLSHFGYQGVIIGGIAVGLLSQTRFTEDLDAMVLLSLDDIPQFIAAAQKVEIIARISQIEEFAKHNRVLLLRHAPSQTNIDISLGALPFEQEVVQRSIVHVIDDTLTIRLPTPEDLIIMKAVAHRPKDLLDIQEIIQSNPDLDRERIQVWVAQFVTLLDMPELWNDIAGWL